MREGGPVQVECTHKKDLVVSIIVCTLVETLKLNKMGFFTVLLIIIVIIIGLAIAPVMTIGGIFIGAGIETNNKVFFLIGGILVIIGLFRGIGRW